MEENKSIRVHNRLFVRIYLYYAIILTFMAVILGVVFMRLYSQNSLENYRGQLLLKAESIADRMEIFLREAKYNEREIKNEVASFIAYLDDIESLTDDIWIISNPNSKYPMDASMENINIQEIDLTDNIESVLEHAFNKNSDSRMGYDKIFGTSMITVGVPIEGQEGEVSGAVLINFYQEYQQALIGESTFFIVISGVVALVISFIIAILFTKSLSKPISKMRNTALKLADGHYKIKTGINKKDEIGDLAKSIDILSDRLLTAEEERKNNEQMRMDFFANVSHELRTPITVIRAYTETLIDGVVTKPEKISQYYNRMLSECKSMERLVGDLLTLSKMQNPDFVIEAEPVNLKQVFEDILRSASAVGKKKHIEFDITMDSNQYMMFGDYDRLRQMFMIILDNAIKFSKEDTAIHISLKKEEKLIVSLRDEGIGIEKEEVPYIFDKFYRSKLRENAKGSGLGLAIARQIALKHGGRVQVKSKLGVGTEFIFIFDLLNNTDYL